MKNDVTIQDVKDMESKLGIELAQERREEILKEYNRLVTDRAEDWETLIGGMIDYTEEGLERIKKTNSTDGE